MQGSLRPGASGGSPHEPRLGARGPAGPGRRVLPRERAVRVAAVRLPGAPSRGSWCRGSSSLGRLASPEASFLASTALISGAFGFKSLSCGLASDLEGRRDPGRATLASADSQPIVPKGPVHGGLRPELEVLVWDRAAGGPGPARPGLALRTLDSLSRGPTAGAVEEASLGERAGGLSSGLAGGRRAREAVLA